MTSGCGDEPAHAAGGPARHIPVLRAAVIEHLSPRAGGVYVDATFGAGGYTQGILAIPGTRVLALDRDPAAIAAGAGFAAAAAGRLDLALARFSTLTEVVRARGHEAVDGVVLDIGVSSMQIDEALRGFSFRHDGPLDMRMEMAGRSAADIVNGAPEDELADMFYRLGEERASRRIARAIVADRVSTPFTTTRQLASMIARVAPARGSDIHPATRTFQALRIAVNDELGELAAALAAAERVLKPGGALVVVSFHSLEDRIVKTFLAARSGRGEAPSRRLPGEPEAPAPTFIVPRGQPVLPTEAETRANPRARSAKLRFATRTGAPPRGAAPARP